MFKITGYLGWAFCELSFRWFSLYDISFYDDKWRWHHFVSWYIGNSFYRAGCWFYSFGPLDS